MLLPRTAPHGWACSRRPRPPLRPALLLPALREPGARRVPRAPRGAVEDRVSPAAAVSASENGAASPSSPSAPSTPSRGSFFDESGSQLPGSYDDYSPWREGASTSDGPVFAVCSAGAAGPISLATPAPAASHARGRQTSTCCTTTRSRLTLSSSRLAGACLQRGRARGLRAALPPLLGVRKRDVLALRQSPSLLLCFPHSAMHCAHPTSPASSCA